MWGLVQIIKMLAWSPWNCWAAAAKTHQNNKPTKCTKRPKILPLLQRQQLQPRIFFAKKFQNHPRETQSLFICCESMIRGKLTCEYGNAESDSRSQTKAKEETHTHRHKTLRLTPDHEIADCLLACKCNCDLRQWRSVLRQFLKGKISNKWSMGCGLGPFPFPNVATSVEAWSLWQEATRKTWGLANIVGFSSIVTLHAGLGFIFSHLNPATLGTPKSKKIQII